MRRRPRTGTAAAGAGIASAGCLVLLINLAWISAVVLVVSVIVKKVFF